VVGEGQKDIKDKDGRRRRKNNALPKTNPTDEKENEKKPKKPSPASVLHLSCLSSYMHYQWGLRLGYISA